MCVSMSQGETAVWLTSIHALLDMTPAESLLPVVISGISLSVQQLYTQWWQLLIAKTLAQFVYPVTKLLCMMQVACLT